MRYLVQLLLVSTVLAQVCLESKGTFNIRDSPCGTVVSQLASGEKTAYRSAGTVTTCTLDGASKTFVPIAKSSGYVAVEGLQVCSGACVKVNTDSLNVRSSPCGTIAATLAQGAQKTVASTTLSTQTCSGKVYAWVNIPEGYVAADFLAPCGGSTPTPPPPPSGGCNTNQKPTAIGQNGLNLIKKFEGLYKCWYKDPVGYPTICYGHLIVAGDPYRQGDCKTEQFCEDLLRGEIGSYARCVTNYITAPLNQNQFDALTSFVFNLGCGALQTSTLRTLLNGGNYAAVCPQLKRFVYAGGKVFQGLVNRRNAECDLFNSCSGISVAGNARVCAEADSCSSCLLNSENDATFALLEGMGRNTSCGQANWKNLADEWCDTLNPWECYWKVPSDLVNASSAQCPMCASRAPPTVPQPPPDTNINCTNTRGDLCLGTSCDVILEGSTCDPASGNCLLATTPKESLPLCTPPPSEEGSHATTVAASFLFALVLVAFL